MMSKALAWIGGTAVTILIAMMTVPAVEAGNNLASFGALFANPITAIILASIGVGALADTVWRKRRVQKSAEPHLDRNALVDRMATLAVRIEAHDAKTAHDHPSHVSLAGEIVSLALTLDRHGYAIPDSQVDSWATTLGRWQRYFYVIGPLIRDGHLEDAREQALAMSEWPYDRPAEAA